MEINLNEVQKKFRRQLIQELEELFRGKEITNENLDIVQYYAENKLREKGLTHLKAKANIIMGGLQVEIYD